jgi:transposase
MGHPKGLPRDFDALEARRLKAAKLFDRGLRPSEVARRLHVHRQSACRWRYAWRQQGTKALRKAARAGRKSRLLPAQVALLCQALRQSPSQHGFATEVWTTVRVAELIRRQTGVRYHPDHVWRLLFQWGFRCQRPVVRAREQDPEAVRRWKRYKWPAIKKKPAGRAD